MVFQVLLDDIRRSPTQLCHGSKGKEGRHPLSSTTLIFSRFVSLSLFLFSYWEGGGEMVNDRGGEM
jgi:hypothetical protein